jgi:hypothetical protein
MSTDPNFVREALGTGYIAAHYSLARPLFNPIRAATDCRVHGRRCAEGAHTARSKDHSTDRDHHISEAGE